MVPQAADWLQAMAVYDACLQPSCVLLVAAGWTPGLLAAAEWRWALLPEVSVLQAAAMPPLQGVPSVCAEVRQAV